MKVWVVLAGTPRRRMVLLAALAPPAQRILRSKGRFEHESDSPGGLVNHRLLDPTVRDSHAVGVG